MHRFPEMPQLLRVARDIDRGDLAVLDRERRSLQESVALEREEARQAVDEAVAQQARHARGEEARELSVKAQHLACADEGLRRRRDLAAAVGIEGDVSGEQRAELIHVAVAR